ncbi:hypothetical protein [Adhaeribacter aquaticus]|uniref:hypothetical protein n=1 Tax=Adhaeribacter aquaticus TaxID=299567 RepID=UPI000404374E|nr:hypothetical protein [Adhaeribacter aquaticus]
MAIVDLHNEGTSIGYGKSGIIVRNNQRSIPGGKSLNVTGFDPTVIPEGHVIIRETATGDFKPMPVTGAAYAALPAGHTYAGINVAEIRTAKPFAGISYECTVNRVASKYPTAPIEAAIKAALPNIHFLED